jgi:hypothetical protein
VAELRKAQAARVEQLAVNLKALLRRYVEGDTGGYEVGAALAGGPLGGVCGVCAGPGAAPAARAGAG